MLVIFAITHVHQWSGQRLGFVSIHNVLVCSELLMLGQHDHVYRHFLRDHRIPADRTFLRLSIVLQRRPIELSVGSD